MKKLHLIRHAKSSWDDSSLEDIERPINNRGVESCRIMAPEIAQVGCGFSNVYSSAATRAQQTIEGLSQNLPDMDVQWQLSNDLYTFYSGDLLSWCRALDESLSEVVLIGHNPAITDFCNDISGSDIGNVPTCGYIQLAIDGIDWCELSSGSAELLHFLYPKMFK